MMLLSQDISFVMPEIAFNFVFIIIQHFFFLLIFVYKILLIANKIFSELHGRRKNKLFLVFLI